MKDYKSFHGKTFGIILNGKTYDWASGEITRVPDNFKDQILKAVNRLEDVTVEKDTSTGRFNAIPGIPITKEIVEAVKTILKPGFKLCLNCNKPFKPRVKTTKFCKRDCYNKWRRKT